jgi:hypothetical protein
MTEKSPPATLSSNWKKLHESLNAKKADTTKASKDGEVTSPLVANGNLRTFKPGISTANSRSRRDAHLTGLSANTSKHRAESSPDAAGSSIYGHKRQKESRSRYMKNMELPIKPDVGDSDDQ